MKNPSLTLQESLLLTHSSLLQLTFPLGIISSITKFPDFMAELGVFSLCFAPCTRHLHLNMVVLGIT